MSKVKVPRFLAVIWWFLAVICRFSKSQILKRCLCCICLCLCHCLCLFVGQDMSPYHSDQMSGRSEVNWIVFCMAFSKVLSQSVSQWVSEWQGHLLSCSGQLKTHNGSICPFVLVFSFIFTPPVSHRWLFQTLNAISTEQSSTIVFPFPINTLSLSMGLDTEKRKTD